MEPRGQELIRRYKANYGISMDRVVTENMILKHWELEKCLRKSLLESTSDSRWDVSERCYNRLYRELPWLNRLAHGAMNASRSILYGNWIDVIGPPPMKVYEVGSGKGELIQYLASCGFACKASEITRERGEKWSTSHPNLSWGTSDGVHFDRFEPEGFYDVVISDQVIEHLHPDDLLDHFRGVLSILVNGGRYIFSTPHISIGPSDISAVFRRDTPMGMHLREYTYHQIAGLLRRAGFQHVRSVLRFPIGIRRLFGAHLKPKASSSYLAYLCTVEQLIATLPTQDLRRRTSRAAKLILFSPSMMIVGGKAQTAVKEEAR